MPFHSPHRRGPRPPNPPFRPRASVPAPFIVQRRMQGLEERSLRSQERESQDYEDFGGGHQGGPAKKFKDGGMVRGAKPGQTSGTKFSGTF
jgi:hypothetical protein